MNRLFKASSDSHADLPYKNSANFATPTPSSMSSSSSSVSSAEIFSHTIKLNGKVKTLSSSSSSTSSLIQNELFTNNQHHMPGRDILSLTVIISKDNLLSQFSFEIKKMIQFEKIKFYEFTHDHRSFLKALFIP